MFGNLLYSLAHERLTAQVGAASFSMCAVSGFGRGWQKKEDEPRYYPVGRTALGYVDKQDWGPIAPGFYRVCRPYHDAKLGRCAKLDASAGPIPFGRGGFYLHGRTSHKHHGRFHEHASHGCVCPFFDRDVEQFDNMLDALQDLHAKSTGTYVAMLRVVEW